MPPPGPLDGIVVLDLTRIVAGPICGRVLADLGADVIKIEPPEGDLSRRVPPIVDGIGALFAQMNAGKRNVGIDIRAPGGAELVRGLARWADVFIENFRPAALSGRGLSYDALRADNPGLIYCSITGFGQTGPMTDRRAHAPMAHAEFGVIETAARLRHAEPVTEVFQHADLYSGMFGVGAVCAALYQRERTGVGQHLDIALAEVVAYVNDHAAIDLRGWDGERDFDTWAYPIVATGDGQRVCLIGNGLRMFSAFMHALGQRTDGAQPVDEQTAIDALREAAGRFATADELLAAVRGAGLAASPIRPFTELAASEWAASRGLLADAAPGVRAPAAPWRSSAADIGLRRPAGVLGADTDAVLGELLGLGPDDLARLRAEGAIAGPTPLP
jgi:crotonobetainyl-CoA:carnitine CoA-transferase CaiB-like acyl-CoA transferase